MRYDLHTHSCYSDGRISPKELVIEAQRIGLGAIALTDHENVGGVPEALAAGQEFAVKVIPGIEFSVSDNEGKEQHLLGLFVDYKSQDLKNFLTIWAETKVKQIRAMLERVRERGFRVEFEDIIAQAKGSLTRAHLGYAILENKENSPLLERLGIKTSSEFFIKILREDSPTSVFVPREIPPIKEVIGLIRGLDGTAVWAHPFWKKDSIDIIREKCRVFQMLGLGAIEVCYNRAFSTIDQALALHQIALEIDLFETAGSDFHSFDMHRYNKLADFDTFGLDLKLPLGM